jgi:hypothetical protein
MHGDIDKIYSEFVRLKRKKYMVEWAGKAAWKLSDEEAVALMYKNECTYCGFAGNLGFDRVNPNGDYEVDNVVPACATCNIMRGAAPVVSFLDNVKLIVENLDLGRRDLDTIIENRLQELMKVPVVTTHNPERKMAVSTVGLMLENQAKNVMKFHSRKCGRGKDELWRIVDISRVMEYYPTATPCNKCVVIPDETNVASDCKDYLPADVSWVQEYANLVRGIHMLRADDFIITDTQKVYHTQLHKAAKIPHFVVTREVADIHMPHLRPCKTCVSFSMRDPPFDGLVDLPLVSDYTELVAARDRVKEYKRVNDVERKQKSRSKI